MPIPKQFSSHNPAYWFLRPFWTDVINLYEPLPFGGGGGLGIAGFLNRYQAEDNEEFSQRVKRVAQVNFCNLIPDLYCSMLFSTEIMISSKTQQDKVKAFVDNCNQQGDSLVDYSREIVAPMALAFGTTDVFVDMPSVSNQVLSEMEAEELGINSPYVYVVPPINREAWTLDDARNYVMYRSIDVLNTQIGAAPQIKDKTQWNVWTPEKVVVYNENGEVIDEKPNAYGFIPAVTVMPLKSLRFHNDRVGISLIQDVVQLQKMVINQMSLILDFHESVNFGVRFFKQDVSDGLEAPTEAEFKEMGNHRAMGMRGAGSDFKIVTPDPSGVEAMCRYLDQIIDKIYQSVFIPSDSNVNKTHQTGQTIRSNQAQLFNRLSRITKHFEKVLKRIVDMALKVQGIKEDAGVTVQWDTNFSFESAITGLQEMVTVAQALQNGQMSPTAQAEYAKKVLNPQLYGSGKLDKISKELDDWAKTMNEAPDPNQVVEPSIQQTTTQFNAAAKVDKAEEG